MDDPLPVEVADDLGQLLDQAERLADGVGSAGERAARLPCGTYSMTRYGAPSHQPARWTGTTCGWASAAHSSAPRRSRASHSSRVQVPAGKTFSATGCLSGPYRAW